MSRLATAFDRGYIGAGAAGFATGFALADGHFYTAAWTAVAAVLFLALGRERTRSTHVTHLTAFMTAGMDEREFANRLADALRDQEKNR